MRSRHSYSLGRNDRWDKPSVRNGFADSSGWYRGQHLSHCSKHYWWAWMLISISRIDSGWYHEGHLNERGLRNLFISWFVVAVEFTSWSGTITATKGEYTEVNGFGFARQYRRLHVVTWLLKLREILVSNLQSTGTMCILSRRRRWCKWHGNDSRRHFKWHDPGHAVVRLSNWEVHLVNQFFVSTSSVAMMHTNGGGALPHFHLRTQIIQPRFKVEFSPVDTSAYNQGIIVTTIALQKLLLNYDYWSFSIMLGEPWRADRTGFVADTVEYRFLSGHHHICWWSRPMMIEQVHHYKSVESHSIHLLEYYCIPFCIELVSFERRSFC